jgi:hypothetical protein
MNMNMNMNMNINMTNEYNESNHVKHKLISYIYNSVDLNKFNYNILNNANDINELSKKKFYVSKMYYGNNYLLIFKKINNKYYSFLIDRKTLSYNKNQLKINNVKITQIYIRLDESIYDGTIFDGTLKYTNNGDKMYFVINDVYMFLGKNIMNDLIKYKLTNIEEFLNLAWVDDYFINNIELSVNKLFDLNQINKIITFEKNKNNIKGFSFYSDISGTTLIYLLKNNSEITKININNNSVIKNNNHTSENINNYITENINNYTTENINNNTTENINNYTTENINNNTAENINNNKNINNNISELTNSDLIENNSNENTKTKFEYKIKTTQNIIITFEIRKTTIADVYKLYLVTKIKKNNKIHIKNKKIDIAYIPTLECSNICKTIFDKNTDKQILINCEFNIYKKKWTPLHREYNKKYPDSIFDLTHIIEFNEIV